MTTTKTTQTDAGAPRNGTGLTDSTLSSTSSSAERYRLDEFDDNPILLYKYRGRLETSSQRDLCAWLDKDERLRVTKKQIPRFTSYIGVQRHDLYLDEEKELYSSHPNFDSSLASIKVPSAAYWNRLFTGRYDQLYIVSPESSPNSSVTDDGSRKASPASSWGQNSMEDSRMGATTEDERDFK